MTGKHVKQGEERPQRIGFSQEAEHIAKVADESPLAAIGLCLYYAALDGNDPATQVFYAAAGVIAAREIDMINAKGGENAYQLRALKRIYDNCEKDSRYLQK